MEIVNNLLLSLQVNYINHCCLKSFLVSAIKQNYCLFYGTYITSTSVDWESVLVEKTWSSLVLSWLQLLGQHSSLPGEGVAKEKRIWAPFQSSTRAEICLHILNWNIGENWFRLLSTLMHSFNHLYDYLIIYMILFFLFWFIVEIGA